jgi:hypothetical protein
MAEYTPNLNLYIPNPSDPNDLAVELSTNFQVIDGIYSMFSDNQTLWIDVSQLQDSSGTYWADGNPPLNAQGIPTQFIDTELRALISKLYTDGQKAVLYFPSGIYGIRDTFNLASGIGIYADKGAHFIKNSAISDTAFAQDLIPGYETMAGYSRNNGMFIIGGIWDCRADYNVRWGEVEPGGGVFKDDGISVQSGFRFYHSQNILMRDMVIQNMYCFHSIEVGGCKNVVIDNVTFAGMRRQVSNSQYPPRESNTEAVQLDFVNSGNKDAAQPFEDLGDMNITINKNIYIQNCRVVPSDLYTSHAIGFGNHSSYKNGSHQDVFIRNNHIEGCLYDGLGLYGIQNSTVEHNVLSQIQDKGIVVEVRAAVDQARNLYNVKVTGNSIAMADNSTDGILFGGYAADSRNVYGMIAAGNVLQANAGGFGVRLFRGVNCIVERNLITGSNYAIYIDTCNQLVLSCNLVTGSGICGLQATNDSNDAIVTGNLFSEVQNKGIFVTGSSDRWILNYNLFRNTAKASGQKAAEFSGGSTKGVLNGNLFWSNQTAKPATLVYTTPDTSLFMYAGNNLIGAYSGSAPFSVASVSASASAANIN